MTNFYAGSTTIQTLEQAIQTVMSSARAVREYKSNIGSLSEKHEVRSGIGGRWIEPTLGQTQAFDVSENQNPIFNPQQIRIESMLIIQPTAISTQTLITDPTRVRMSRNVMNQMGMQAGNAMLRLRDIKGIIALNASTPVYGAFNASLDSSDIRAARAFLEHNPTEPAMGMFNFVAHGWQLLDLENELISNVGGANFGQISEGVTARVWQSGFRGTIKNVAGVMIYDNDHIDTNGNQASAHLFPKEGLVCVGEKIMRKETQRLPGHGEGADLLYLREKFAYGLRNPDRKSARLRSDATAPA